MRAAAWLALAAVALAAPAAGQTVPVRSGEHETFSRLVFGFAERPEWRLQRVEDGYELRFARDGLRFDLDAVFRFIPRSRIRSVTQDAESGVVTITLGCLCHADAFEYRDVNLVIDIRDGPDPEASAFEEEQPAVPEEVAAPQPAPPVPPGLTRRLAEPRTEETVGLTTPLPGPLADSAMRLAPEPPATPQSPAPPAPAGALSEPTWSRPVATTGTSTALAEALARAASQGLVDADLSTGLLGQPADAGHAAESRLEPAAPAPPDNEPMPAHGANIRVQTSIDRDLAAIAPDLRARLGDGVCLDAARVNLPAWGDPDTPGADIGRYRGALAAARDTPEPHAVTALARHYLFLSFGQEALALMATYPGRAADEALLRAMAGLIEGAHLQPPHPFEGQAGCPGPAALWGLLAEGEAETGVAAPSVLAAFSVLPLHLRRHLGPQVSERFLALGDTASAAAVLNAIERAPGEHGDAIALAAVRLGLAEDREAEESGAALTPLVRSEPLIAAEATLLLLNQALDAPGPVPGDLVETAGAFSFQLAGQPVAAGLKSAEIRALSRNGAHRLAIERLDRAGSDGIVGAESDAELRTEVYMAAAASAPDAEIGLLALAAREDLGIDGDAAAARRALADRLTGLGLTDLARTLLPSPDERLPQDRFVAARGHLADGNPLAAEREITGLGGAEIAPIRAEILAAGGQHGRAAAIFDALDAPDRSLQEAVLSGTWEGIAAVASPALSGPARTLADRPETPPAPDAASGAALLSEAEEARAGLNALLEATRLPD